MVTTYPEISASPFANGDGYTESVAASSQYMFYARDDDLHIVDRSTWSEISESPIVLDDQIQTASVKVDPTETYVATGSLSAGSLLQVWEIGTWNEVYSQSADINTDTLSWNDDGSLIVFRTADYEFTIVDSSTWSVYNTVTLGTSNYHYGINMVGDEFAIGTSQGATFRSYAYDIDGNQVADIQHNTAETKSEYIGASPDYSTFCHCSSNGIAIIDTDTWSEEKLIVSDTTGNVRFVDIGYKHMIAVSSDGLIEQFSTDDYTEVSESPWDTGLNHGDAQFSADKSLWVRADFNDEVWAYEAPTVSDVSGTVVDSDGVGVSDALVICVDTDSNSVEDWTTSGSDGSFTVQAPIGSTVHIVGEYDDGSTMMNFETNPYIQVTES